MEFTFKRGYVGSPLHSLENIPQTSLDVQQKPVPPHVTITGSRNRDKADVISHAANGKAIVSALKNLQEKIRCLEVERTEAEKKMQNLTYESVKFKNTVEQEEKNSTNIKTGVSNELSVQLSTVEGRCSLLEKQLEYMRTMVDHTQTEKSILLQKQASLQMDRQWNPAELQSKLEKLEILEQECLKVNATQTRAESKINELEQKLQEEEHQRKLIQDKAAQLQTGLELNRILIGSCSVKKKKKTKKKKDTVKNEMREKSSWSPRVRTGLAEFPFVAGTSISTSHSVTANVQNVFHLMKHYNTMMSDGRQKLPVQRTPQNSRKTTYDSGKVKNGDLHFVSPYSSASSPTEGLTEILLALQDELGQMSFEHQDLLKQIQGTKNTDVREDLERELDCLVKRMEKKADQISKLRKHQDKTRTPNTTWFQEWTHTSPCESYLQLVSNPPSCSMENINPPPPLCIAGNLVVNWKLFKQRFQLFLEATDRGNASDTRKIALLLSTAGPHAIHIFNSLTFADGEDKTKYKTVLLKCDEHFSVEVNESFERYLFQQRLQGKDEPFQSYLMHLRILAQSCGYGPTSDSMIRDQIVFGVMLDTLRQQLLKIKQLTLATAIETCVLHENATSRYSHIQAAETARQGPHEAERVQTIEYLPARGPEEGDRFARFPRPPVLVRAKRGDVDAEECDVQARTTQDRTMHAWSRNERTDVMTCGNCASAHLKRQCPAKARQCLRCGRLGHYAACCRALEPGNSQQFNQPRRNVWAILPTFTESDPDIIQTSDTEDREPFRIAVINKNKLSPSRTHQPLSVHSIDPDEWCAILTINPNSSPTPKT